MVLCPGAIDSPCESEKCFILPDLANEDEPLSPQGKISTFMSNYNANEARDPNSVVWLFISLVPFPPHSASEGKEQIKKVL